MPHAIVEIRRSWSDAEEVAIIDAVHEALVAAFQIPPGDRHIRLVEHQPHRFATPPDLEAPELFTLVTVDCFTGRSLEAKRNLYSEVVQRLGDVGIPPDHISILVRDHPTENWGIEGGQAACDVNLGYKVNV